MRSHLPPGEALRVEGHPRQRLPLRLPPAVRREGVASARVVRPPQRAQGLRVQVLGGDSRDQGGIRRTARIRHGGKARPVGAKARDFHHRKRERLPRARSTEVLRAALARFSTNRFDMCFPASSPSIFSACGVLTGDLGVRSVFIISNRKFSNRASRILKTKMLLICPYCLKFQIARV